MENKALLCFVLVVLCEVSSGDVCCALAGENKCSSDLRLEAGRMDVDINFLNENGSLSVSFLQVENKLNKWLLYCF